MTHRLVRSPRARPRLLAAAKWLTERGTGARVLVVGAQRDAARDVVRLVASRAGASFGWTPTTLDALARELAGPALAAAGLAPAPGVAVEAVCARVVAEASAGGTLGRFEPVAETPGLPRALARTLGELRLADMPTSRLPQTLATLADAFDEALAATGLADRAAVLKAATAAAEGGSAGPALLLLDPAIGSPVEQRFVTALAARAPHVLVTLPTGDARTARYVSQALSAAAVARGDGGAAEFEELLAGGEAALARLQRNLFAEEAPPEAPADGSVVLMSAPGEGREAVEIARRIHRAADRGMAFDRIAVLTRSPELYRAHLEEALRRAGVPAWFDRGARRPDLGGRALLALLACAAEGLSARRFAEYLSLGEVPDAEPAGAPPEPVPPAHRWVPAADADAEVAPDEAPARHGEDGADGEDGDVAAAAAPGATTAPVYRGTLRAPRRWEQLLVEAAVIGGLDRWRRRLDGLRAETETWRETVDDEDPKAGWIDRRLVELRHLEAFALPLLADLADLPAAATWGVWIDLLGDLATRAVAHPERVLALLGALLPMASVGPVDLAEVRRVLEKRLTDLVEYPSGRRFGRVFVGPPEAARGRSFEMVFVPGVAERLFPKKLVEDPILLDELRRGLSADLETADDRVDAERLRLRLAVGAANKQLVLSWPRIDTARSRPRVPSFYGLEVVRAAEGTLPGFGELAARGDAESAVRIAWPAPADPGEAIDPAEHDLALFDRVRRKTQPEAAGTMRYLLEANPFLARSLRARYARWTVSKFNQHDGLVAPREEAAAAMAAHQLEARSFSATALQDFASCPYRFALRTVFRLAPREVPEAIEYLDPLSRGSLVHDTQFEVLTELRSSGRLPITAANLRACRDVLDATLDAVAARYAEELVPAIPRVWNDAVAAIRTDLREWLRLLSEDVAWTPHRFELAFGLSGDDGRDEHSVPDPVPLDCGIRLRGSIDLVEQARDGSAIRVTDSKTGRARVSPGAVIKGGAALQPVLYALAAEKLLELPVVSGRLWYCTSAGGFKETEVELNDRARDAAEALAQTLGGRLERHDFPAFPAEGSCRWCDYQPVCGPHEELRAGPKSAAAKADLVALRSRK